MCVGTHHDILTIPDDEDDRDDGDKNCVENSKSLPAGLPPAGLKSGSIRAAHIYISYSFHFHLT